MLKKFNENEQLISSLIKSAIVINCSINGTSSWVDGGNIQFGTEFEKKLEM